MADDELWRRRFSIFMLTRLFGVATFFLGIAIIYTDLLREGGWPAVGAIVVIVGIIDAVFAPKLLRKLWEQQDRERR
jgi:hypothetical protein